MCRTKLFISFCSFLIVMLKIYTVFGIDENLQLRKAKEMDYYKAMLDFYALQSDAIVSEQCKIDCELYKKAFINKELWALKMYDSSSKMQSGFLSGNLADFGDFNQCINIEVVVDNNTTIRGKYILTSLRGYLYFSPLPFQAQAGIPMLQMPYLSLLNNTLSDIKVCQIPENVIRRPGRHSTGHKWTICVPDSCNLEEVVKHLQLYMNRGGITNVDLENTLEHTLDSQWRIRPTDWIVIGLFMFIVFLMLISTIYDTYLHYSKNKIKHWILTAFSVLSNGRRLVAVSNNPELLPCLDGIRVLCITWVLLGHETDTYMQNFNYNSIESYEMVRKFWFQIIYVNQVCIKQFIMLSGFLVMYSFLRYRERESTFNIIMFYIRRYLRLTPSLIAVILVHLSILRILASGPMYQKSIIFMQKYCEDNWWHTLLYVSNYADYNAICVPQSWYLCVDTQLYWLSPLILLPVVWYKKIAYYLFGIVLLIGIAEPWYIVYDKKLSAWAPSNYLTDYYIATPSYFCSWIIGIALGYFVYHNKGKKFKIQWWVATLLWTIAIGLCAYSALGVYPNTQPNYVYNRGYYSWFVAFSPVFWCLGASWIIFACIFGYGGIVNWFLTLPMWQPLSKLTYSMFITHYWIQIVFHATLKTPQWYSPMNLFYNFCGLMGTTICVSLIWIMAFEMPFLAIDTNIFRKVKSKNQTTLLTMTIPKKDVLSTTNRYGVSQ